MSNTVMLPQATLRAEIESVLRETAATAKWLAHQLGAPVLAVREECEQLAREGRARVKIVTGQYVYRLRNV